MADITRLAHFVDGLPREVDLTTNSLQVGSLKVGTTTPAELTKDMVALLNTINTTGLPAANLSAEAKQAALEYKLAAMRVGVLNFMASNSASSDTVTTQVQGAASIDTPVGAGGAIGAVAAKGIFVGTVSGASDIGKVLIRVTGTDNGIDDGTGDEIYGVLSESSGVFTLSYKKADGGTYTMPSDTNIDFYFIEVFDLYSFGVDRLLMPAINGVVDATTASSVLNEKLARIAADWTLQNNIYNEASARIAADGAEATARIAADSNLDSMVQAEVTARINADWTLQSNIDAELTARLAADSLLQLNIDAEATARLVADSSLQSAIEGEISARILADSTLQLNIDAEATARLVADSSLQSSIEGEISARILADSTLQLNIDAEATARLVADSSLQSSIEGEISARILADSTLQLNIDAEATARLVADSSLQSSIEGEISARILADSTLQLNIDAEATARLVADSSLQSSIEGEISARILADSTLQLNIDAEATARLAADSVLQTNIEAEITARLTADSSLQSAIDAINVSVVDIQYVAAAGGITTGDVVALSQTVAGEVIKANATGLSTCESVVGVALETKSAGAQVKIRAFGEATVTTDGTNFDLGKRVYVSTTAGQASKTAPSSTDNVVYLVGGATATNKVFVNTNLEYVVV